MKRIAIIYGAIHANVLLLSSFLVGYLNQIGLVFLQVNLLTLVIWDWMRYGGEKVNLSVKQRTIWVIGSLIAMSVYALLIGFVLPEIPLNQEGLNVIQLQVPLMAFALFLINASIIEEYWYRELIWEKLQWPILQLLISSVLFTGAHQPTNLVSWLIYIGLAISLGLVRLKTDCLTAMLCHLCWNILVLVLSIV